MMRGPADECAVSKCRQMGAFAESSRADDACRHAGGVHCLLADGKIQFVSDTIDHGVWVSSGTINGEELDTVGQQQ